MTWFGVGMSDEQKSASYRHSARAMWEAGDYDGLISTIRTSAPKDFVAGLNAAPPGQVLDIACGTGSTALPLARLGFDVTGLDLSPRMLDMARNKARGEGLAICFDEGVVEALPYPDASFDMAVSMFGIMFSPMPQDAIREAARVLKPGGRLAVASWTRSGFSGRMGGLLAPYMPSKSVDAALPPDWGDADQVRELLEPYFDQVEARVTTITWTVDLRPTEAAKMFFEKAGPVQVMRSDMTEEQRGKVSRDNEQFWTENIPRRTLMRRSSKTNILPFQPLEAAGQSLLVSEFHLVLLAFSYLLRATWAVHQRRADPQEYCRHGEAHSRRYRPMRLSGPGKQHKAIQNSHAEVGFLRGLSPPLRTVSDSEKSYRPRKLRWRQISGERWARSSSRTSSPDALACWMASCM